MSKGKPLQAKLFLEGIEVPFTGASITCAVNRASIAYIDLVPLDEIKHIKPRTLIHIFVRDISDQKGGYPYILAWEGEVFGFSYGRTTTSRTFTIKGIDYTSYWDSTLVHFWDLKKSQGKAPNGIIDQAQAEQSARRNQIASKKVLMSQTSFYFRKLDEALKSDPPKDFLGAFISVLESLAEVNDFYQIGEDKLRITDRFVQASSGELTKLLSSTQHKSWISKMEGRRSGFHPIRALVNDMIGLIFHDYASIPFPAQVARAATLKGSSLQTKDNSQKTVGSFAFKPNTYMLTPPACNIFFPDEYSSFQYDRNFFAEPTRMTYKPTVPGPFLKGVNIQHVYQPESFHHYVYGHTKDKDEALRDPAKYQGAGEDFVPVLKDDAGKDLSAKEFPGFMHDDTSRFASANDGKNREQNYMTNGEMMKGIWAAFETELPAVLAFTNNIAANLRPEFTKKIAKYLLFKKRYEGRGLQITSHLKLSVAPGFPALVLDDSEAGQSTLAYCESVTHRIYANQGGYTNCIFSYARDVDEQDVSSNNGKDPPVPEWFSQLVVGDKEKGVDKDATTNTFPKGLSAFYESLLGAKGNKHLADVVNIPNATASAAVQELLKQYRAEKGTGERNLDRFISRITRRDYISMDSAFDFLGAATGDAVDSQYMIYRGNALNGLSLITETKDAQTETSFLKTGGVTQITGDDGKKKNVDYRTNFLTAKIPDSLGKDGKPKKIAVTSTVETSNVGPQSLRKDVILAYQKKLKERRGFVG